MSLIAFILLAALQGLIVGALARLALPGKDPMSIMQTIAVGIGGALIAGVVVYLITDGEAAPGFLASFAAAVLIVYIVRRRRGGSLTKPSGHDETSRPTAKL